MLVVSSIASEPEVCCCVLACWWYMSWTLQTVSGYGALLQFWPADYTCYWLSSLWVAVVPFPNYSLLMMPVFDSPDSEQIWCLAVILACWWCLSLALQDVSGCDALLQFWLANNACHWLFRWSVAVVSCCNSSLLMMPVLGSSGCEWIWCLAAFLVCWWCLSLTLQDVSGCGVLMQF